MSRYIASLVALSIAIALCAPAVAKKNNPNVSLEFTPQQAVAAAVADVAGAMLTRPVVLHLEDERNESGENARIIGTRTDDDDRRHVLRATSDVLEFVEEQLVQSAQRWGIDFDDGADLALGVRLLQFEILETNQAVGSTYNATVRLAYSLGPPGGEPRTSGTAIGDATRYGKKFSNANCNEVLSDAMLEAFAELFSDYAVQRAWGE